MRRAFAPPGNTRSLVASLLSRRAITNGQFKKSQPQLQSQWQYGPNSGLFARDGRRHIEALADALKRPHRSAISNGLPRGHAKTHSIISGWPTAASETLYPTALNKRADGHWSICSHLAVPNLLPTRYDNLAEAEPGLTWCD